jgi:hypothetical protein
MRACKGIGGGRLPAGVDDHGRPKGRQPGQATEPTGAAERLEGARPPGKGRPRPPSGRPTTSQLGRGGEREAVGDIDHEQQREEGAAAEKVPSDQETTRVLSPHPPPPVSLVGVSLAGLAHTPASSCFARGTGGVCRFCRSALALPRLENDRMIVPFDLRPRTLARSMPVRVGRRVVDQDACLDHSRPSSLAGRAGGGAAA